MIYEPLWAVLDVTNRCNLHCKHCSCTDTNDSQELTLHEWQRIISDLVANGCRHVTLSGGEPLLYKDIYDLIRYSKECGLETTVASNGIDIDKSVITRLVECKIDGVQISIDGLQNNHDFLRGKDTFLQATHAIRLLGNSGIRCSTMTVLSSINMNELGPIVEYLATLSVNYMGFERFTPVGRGLQLRNSALTVVEVMKAFHMLNILSESYPIKINDPLKILLDPLLIDYAKRKYFPCGGCLAGIATCAISAIGELRLCTRIPQYILGRLTDDNFQTLWSKNDVVNRLRRRVIGNKCMKCDYRYACGGCRAEALAINKDLFADDPACWIQINSSA